jgi:DNA-binding transcriptional ArsR family regulator
VDLTSPARAVVPTRDLDVLLVLAGTTMPMTGRQIYRIGGPGSRSGVQIALLRLVKHGLVDFQKVGSANLYTLNRDHVAAPAVLALVGLRSELFNRIKDHLTSWRIKPVAAAVFGSAARGDGGTDSDIDLFIVRPEKVPDDEPDWGDDVATLRDLVRRWSGNYASIIQTTPSQVASMLDRKEPIVESLHSDAISLMGRDILDATEVVE